MNGIFGSLGNAGAAVIAGILIDVFGWRMAFMIPGVICAATGLWMWLYVKRELIVDGDPVGESDEKETARRDFIKVSVLLLISLAVGGLIYQSTQTALPKHFDIELADWSLNLLGGFTLDTSSATSLGAIVSIVYSSSIVMQYVGGMLADRYSLKVHLCDLLVPADCDVGSDCNHDRPQPCRCGDAGRRGQYHDASCGKHVDLSFRALTPRSLIFGIKFVITFSAAPLSVALVAFIEEATSALDMLFGGLAAATLVVALLLVFLPQDKPAQPGVAPAE